MDMEPFSLSAQTSKYWGIERSDRLETGEIELINAARICAALHPGYAL
jgi:hypothetical protein